MARLLLCFRTPLTRDRDDSDTSLPGNRNNRRQEVQPTNSAGSGSVASQEPKRTVAFVELLKHKNEPLGLVLKGGADCNQPVYVGQLHPGGVAEKSGALQIGDHIRGINGTATDHLNQSEVNALLSNSGNVINLEIEFEVQPGSNLDSGTMKKTALINLQRERNNFGFTISGGQMENRPITVSNVTVGSMAYKNGLLKAGDRILKINWNDVTRATLMEALTHLKSSEDSCTLEIEYDVTVHEGLNEYRGQLLVELLKPKGATLGIGLQGSTNLGGPLVISKIRPAGIADRCGALHVGDRLLSLNKQNLEGIPINNVHRMLKYCDLNLELEIIPGHNFPPGSESAFSNTPSRLPHLSSRLSGRDSQSMLSLSSLATTTVVSTHPETMIISLEADDIGYGMGLQGGATERGVYPIIIASIEAGGPAAKLGQMQVGDQVLSVDGMKVEGYSLQEVLKLVQEADNTVQMEIMFEVQDAIPPSSGTFDVHMKKKTASLNLGIRINGSRSRGDTIWIASLKKGGIAYRSGMLHPGDVILSINGQSLESCNLREAAQLLMNAGESITLRIGKESAPAPSETIIYSVELHRNQQSLGITLTGSREQAGHPIVISNIKEDGVAHRTGTLKVGDRILAINGESLYNKTVPEAVRMLNSAGDVVNLKISKATRRHKSRHKSGSPTGKLRGHMREYGGPIYHRESFGSSASSFISPPGWHNVRPLNHRSRFSFEPVLGESASSCNTPDLSHRSLMPSSLFTGQHEAARMRGGERLITPTSELSGNTFTPTGSFHHVPRHWHYPKEAPGPLDEDQMSSVSSRAERSFYLPGSELQNMLRQHKSSRVGGVSKRDSSTDDEMSVCELEESVSKYRRTSLPEKSLYSIHHHSPMHAIHTDRGEKWNFKSRSHAHRQAIPIGRVSPLTPTETERISQQLKDTEKSLQFKDHGSLPDIASSPANGKGSPPLNSIIQASKDKENEGEAIIKGKTEDDDNEEIGKVFQRSSEEDDGNEAKVVDGPPPSAELSRNIEIEGQKTEQFPIGSLTEEMTPSLPLSPEGGAKETIPSYDSADGELASNSIFESSQEAEDEFTTRHAQNEYNKNTLTDNGMTTRQSDIETNTCNNTSLESVDHNTVTDTKVRSKNTTVTDNSAIGSSNDMTKIRSKNDDNSTPKYTRTDATRKHGLLTNANNYTRPSNTSSPPISPLQSNFLSSTNSHILSPSNGPYSPLSKHMTTEDTTVIHKPNTKDKLLPPHSKFEVATAEHLLPYKSEPGSITPEPNLKPLVPSLSEFKKFMKNADDFRQAMALLAESGSSDQDSDSEPYSKISALPPHEHAKVMEKMKASTSTVLHQVVIRKEPGEVSFGFSISDGQYDQGVYVKTVKPGGASDRGGLQQYDKITKVNDVTLQAEHKSENVYPLLKKHENELVLMIKRQPQPQKPSMEHMLK